MDENIDFDFVPVSNARQELLPYQHEPEPDILRETDSESIQMKNRQTASVSLSPLYEMETRIGEIYFLLQAQYKRLKVIE